MGSYLARNADTKKSNVLGLRFGLRDPAAASPPRELGTSSTAHFRHNHRIESGKMAPPCTPL